MKITAPASIGNISVGYDCLGLALRRIDGKVFGDELEIVPSQSTEYIIKGPFGQKLPDKIEDNIIYHCHQRFLNSASVKNQNTKITLFKNLPIGSGLGSSSASIVATLAGLNAFYGNPLRSDEVLNLMGEMEGVFSGSAHYDNVAPCFLGGLQLMQGHKTASLPTFEDWFWIVCYSGGSLSTKASREVLPKTISVNTATQWSQLLAGFIHYSHCKNSEAALEVMIDVIAEPYRQALLPGLVEIKNHAPKLGAKTIGISGSGPSIFAVATNLDDAKSIKAYFEKVYIQNAFGFCHICQVDTHGVQIETH